MSAPRRLVVALLVVVALGLGAAGVRVADVGHTEPDLTVDTDGPPRERIQSAGRLLNAVDHRLVTRVYRVEGDERTLRAEYRHVRAFTDREHLAVYDTYTAAETRAVRERTQFHSRLAFFHAGLLKEPGRTVVYATDGGVTAEFGVGDGVPNATAPPRFDEPNRDADVSPRELHESFGDVFVPHDAEWRRVNRTNGTVTYAIDDPDAQFETRPVPFGTDLLPGSHVRVTLDAETGRLRAIDERRVLRYDVREVVDGEERFRTETVEYVVETRVDRYGTAAVDRPAGGAPSLSQLLADLLRY